MKKTIFITAAILLISSLFLSSCGPVENNTLTSFEGVWTLTDVSINDNGEKLDFTYDYTKPILYCYLDLPGIMTLKSLGNDKYAMDSFYYEAEDKIWYRFNDGYCIIKDNKIIDEEYEDEFIPITNITENSITVEGNDEDFSVSMTFKRLSKNADDVDKFIKYTDEPMDFVAPSNILTHKLK